MHQLDKLPISGGSNTQPVNRVHMYVCACARMMRVPAYQLYKLHQQANFRRQHTQTVLAKRQTFDLRPRGPKLGWQRGELIKHAIKFTQARHALWKNHKERSRRE